MSVSHYLKPGISQNGRVQIMTVDPATRRVEGMMKGDAMLQIAVWDVPAAFRWPKEGEVWQIYCESGIWKLGSRIQDGPLIGAGPTVQKEAEAAPIESLAPGTMKLDASVVVDETGKTFVAVDLTGIEDGWTLVWSASQKRFVAGPNL